MLVPAPSLSTVWLLWAIVAAGLDLIGGAVIFIPSILYRMGRTARWDTPRRRRRGLVVVLSGIEGPSLYARAMAVGILRSGWRGAVVVSRWGAGPPVIRSLNNLMNSAHHERQAAALRDLIADHRRRHGMTRVALVAQSGGCWIVLRCLEQLSPEPPIDAAVLLAPAVSPRHDPAAAARSCREGLHAFCGHGDLFFLGLGTTLLGTCDRRHRPAAGLVGWPLTGPAFTQSWWRPEWIRLGYIGNHISSCSPAFVAAIVAPILTGRRGLASSRLR